MLFTNYLNQINTNPSSVNIGADWMQGRACYGGLIAALVYESMRKQLSDTIPVRSLQISFVGPVSAEDFVVESEVLRQGKSVSQILGRGLQDNETKIVILGSFGKSRESAIQVDHQARIFDEDPVSIAPMPFIEGVLPNFTRHFDFRYCTEMPFSGSMETVLRGFIRYQQTEPKITEGHIMGLVDAWPPTTLPMLDKPAPASSLSWTIEFVHPQPELDATEFCHYEAKIVQASSGYGHTKAKVWNHSGELIAISQQTVTHFA
jgi:acyl-CoA thioesterase